MLDDLAPHRGAFSYAVSWARQLGLPIYGIGTESTQDSAPSLDANRASLQHACAAACAQHGVSWRYSRVPSEASVYEYVEPTGLFAFSRSQPAMLKREVLAETRGAATLICPDATACIGRMLILDHEQDAGARNLAAAVRLCHQIGATPIVLTIGRSMHTATNHQQRAQHTLHATGLSADFDLLIGFDVRNTVMSIARWRRCQLIVIEGEQSYSWWRWLRRREGRPIAGPNESLALLALWQGLGETPFASSLGEVHKNVAHRSSFGGDTRHGGQNGTGTNAGYRE